MDATKGSLSSSINEFRSDIDTFVQDSVQEITATLASQKQDMDYMNRYYFLNVWKYVCLYELLWWGGSDNPFQFIVNVYVK